MSIKDSPIAVIGAGSWGTALSLLLARNGNIVRLWGHERDEMALLQQQRENKHFLPGFSFPNNLQPCMELDEALDGVRDVLMVVPSHAFRSVLENIKKCGNADLRFAWGTKGIDAENLDVIGKVIAEVFSEDTPAAVLSGPSFAAEVAADMPTAVSLAGNDEQFLQDCVERFHSDRFRVYLNPDFIGVQLCGAIKNVLAIAVGIADGLKLGANTRSALMTRGLAEMSRLCEAMGGQQKTLMSLAGAGDLILTCTDNQSRNRRFGLSIGQGMESEAALQKIGQAVEGLKNAKQVHLLAQKFKVDMPITEQVYRVLYESASAQDVLTELLERAPKVEG